MLWCSSHNSGFTIASIKSLTCVNTYRHIHYSPISWRPKICHNRRTCPKGRSLPSRVDAASYLLLGFLTSSHSCWYDLASRSKAAWWILTWSCCTTSRDRRGEWTTSTSESQVENLRRACWSCDGWVAGRCDKGSCGNNRDHLLYSVQIQVVCESAYVNLIGGTDCHRFF